jgi:hypothetical protein
VEYDWVVAPGADPGQIQLRFGPGTPVRLDEASGELALGPSGCEVRLAKPVAYQLVEGRRVAVAARYAVLGAGKRVGLVLGGYDAGRPLIIDPMLVYSTYLGGNDDEGNVGIAVDAWGNAYVTGYTASTDFPTAHPLANQPVPLPSHVHAFVSKLSFNPKSGTLRLAYSTYLGGSGGDFGQGIAVDRAGNAYVTGVTASSDFSTAFPLATNAALRGPEDAFVVKIGTLRFEDREVDEAGDAEEDR